MTDAIQFIFFSKSADIKTKKDPLYGFGFPPNARKLLSNFALLSVHWQGHEYPTVEHAFQAAKYLYSSPINKALKFSERFQSGSDLGKEPPSVAKSTGTKTTMSKFNIKLNVEEWNRVKDDIMKDIIYNKVVCHSSIQQILHICDTHKMDIVHYSMRDQEWGAKIDKITKTMYGRNKLGHMYKTAASHLDAAHGLSLLTQNY